MAAHAAADRTVGVLLVRLGGYAWGLRRLAASAGELEDRKPAGARPERGGRLVPAPVRPAPENQAATALRAAADAAVAVFAQYARTGWTRWCSAG